MKGRRSRKRRWQAAVAVLLSAAALLAVYRGGRWLEDQFKQPEVRGDYRQRYAYDSGNTIEIDGVTYRQKQNLTTILLLGIDKPQNVQVSGYRNGGQADFLRLIVLDSESETMTQLAIDRDTMTPITILGVLGNKSGVRTSQISLSHGFGDGGEQSCELTQEAVENLLLDVQIDFYAAMNLDGISVLNDWVGGVTVTLEDDFSSIDPGMTEGTTLTLIGDQAETYVRSRMSIGVGTNEARMERQQQYISGLTTLIDAQVRADQNAIGELYDVLEPYLTTDLSRGRLINEVWAAKDYERMATIELPGEHQLGSDGFMQFYVSEEELQDIVLDLFYEEVK